MPIFNQKPIIIVHSMALSIQFYGALRYQYAYITQTPFCGA